MVVTKGSFVNKRGNELYTSVCLPDAGDTKAVIFWHHGFGEYIDRFEESFKTWSAAGIAVYGFDAHGMGHSEPRDEGDCGLIKRWSNIVDDAVQFLAEIIKPSLEANGITAPLFMAGNSMGGLAACYVVLARPDDFTGLILQSPALDVEWTPLLRVQASIGNVMAALVPRAKLIAAVRPEDMSQDPAVVKAYLEDPLIYQGNVKAQSGNEMLKAFRSLRSKRETFTVPILGVHGTSDRCTSLPALRDFLKRVASKDVTLKEIEGGYHELLQGPEKAEVVALISDWVLKHTAAAKEAPQPAAAAEASTGEAAATPAAARAPAAEAPAPAAEDSPAAAADPQ